ncbi:MAG: tandem-95 repeat protein [Verrucomicrobia bacterium]|nr:tandem-95 repeat protein [Verrucomicrobiota bacterium]
MTVTDPRGLAFQTNGNLLVLSGNSLQRYFPSPGQAVLGPPTVLVTGLDNPQRVMVDDATGNIYVSVHGASHQVKVFSGNGAFIRDIGIPGAPATGPYDPAKMHRPMGMTISGDGTLWVAEEDYAPRRVSVWQTDGTFVRAFYGSTDYGGGGSLDPLDKSIFRYRDDHGAGAMEFQLDWATGSNTLVSLYHRPTTNDLPPPNNSPQAALVNVFNGETNVFLTDCYSDNPVGGRFTIGLWQMREGQAKFVAAFGMANTWAPLQTTQFNAMVPPPGNVFASVFDKPVLFVWSDLNDDGIIQTNEVQFRSEQGGYATVNQNLEFATVKAHVFSPVSFTSNGVPIYDLNAGQFAATNFYLDGFTTGSGEVMQTTNGWTVTTGGPLNGMTGGQLMWTYPNPWPSLLAAANAPIATNGGQLVGTTRLLGTTVRPRSGDAGDLFAVNGDYGQVYLFTTDGLFLSTLFKDSRTVPAWSMPVAQRNMSLTGVTLQQECFWDTINQTGDGEIYFVAGHNHASIVRVDGLTNVTRLATNDLVVTPELVIAAANYQTELEILRQSQVGYDTLTAQLVAAQLVMDGQSNDWSTASVVPIDAQASAAVMLTSNYLYAAYWTGDSNLLVNSGVSTELLFKTGGALDLMLATDPNADPTRTAPVAGDLRLLVTLANGAVKATLYRAVVPGTTNPVPFSSPYRTIYLDRVDDVSASVQLAIGPGGFYEFRVPLALLGFAPTNGEVTLGDVGLLRGAGGATVQRVYWHNKSTGLVSDVPSEAELTPELWGHLQIGAFVPPVAATPYEVWRNQKFAPWELGSASIVSPNADPNGDGVPNQLAYALNLEPKSQQPANLPGVASASNHLTVSYTRVKTATDINYSVLVSGDLATWSSGPAFTTVSGVTDFGLTEKITVSDLTAMSATNRRFMRLKVDGVTGSLAVTVTQPVTGNFFIAPANIAITAAPTSGNSFVNRVEFYNGATKIGERTNAPYSMVWSNISLGGYALSARALDSLGNNATSPVVSISVFSALPFISAVANQVINEDTIAGPIAFTLGDADTPISNLVLSASAADTNLLPTANITFGGSGTNRTVTLQPATNANGVTTVTLAITDGNSIVTQPFQLTVLAVNDAPFAFNQSLTNAEDTALPVTLTGFDVEGSPLTFTVVGTPAHGALSGVAPNLSYLPATNYFGPDAFTFRVSDGSLTSTVATVSITVTPVNDAPVADAQAVSTFEDFAKAITLTGSDVEGSNLTYAIVAPPAHGSLSGTPPNVTYLPATNYFGTDSFTFKVNDGQLDSTPATVSLTINAVNDPPVAIAQSITTPEDIATNLTLTGFDVEGSNLTFAVITGPTNGTLTGVAPNLLYRPNTNFFGTDSFTFRANDGQADSAAATVSLTITPVNDAPVAFTNLVVATENQPRPITLTGADLEGSNLVFSIVSTPTNGTLSGTPPNVTYLGATNFNGQDSFTFKVNDGQLDSLPARVVVSVSHSNYPPVANAQSVTNAEDTAKAITLTGSDLEGSNLTFSVVGSPAHGSLSGSAPNLTYLPATNYFGSDSFTFKANDGQLDSAPATVSITVTPVNDAPTASLTGLTNGTPFFVPTNITLTASASDVDGTVSKVEFYAGAVKIGEKTNAPYTITWTNPASADYALTAVATDNSGALGTSAVVNVSVIWFRGINLNGTNVTVEGRSWMGYAQAQSNGLTVANSGNGSTSITPVPATDFDTRSMLQKYLYRLSPATNQGINFTQTIPNGSYKVYLWMMEDFQNNFRSMDVKLEGTPVATNIGLQSVGGWTRYGPYSTTVSDGVLNLDVLKNKNDISVSGVVIVSPNGNSGAP